MTKLILPTLEDVKKKCPKNKISEIIGDDIDVSTSQGLRQLADIIDEKLRSGIYSSCLLDDECSRWYVYRDETEEEYNSRLQKELKSQISRIRQEIRQEKLIAKIEKLNPDLEYSTQGPIARRMSSPSGRESLAKAMLEPINSSLKPEYISRKIKLDGYFYKKGTNEFANPVMPE